MKNRPVVLKLGGELLEGPGKLTAIGKVIKRASAKRPLIVVHGGGREIDAALASVGIPKRQVDGLRVTDPETLDIVVSVLAGSINTRFVAAINKVGGKAVGLTGADAGVAPVKKAAPHKATSGDTVDLGMVGTPDKAPAPALLAMLCKAGIRAGDRLHQRVERREVVQRQRRHARRQPGRAPEGEAAGDRGRHRRRARQARADDSAAEQRAHREARDVGHGQRRHGGQADRLPGGAQGRRAAAS